MAEEKDYQLASDALDLARRARLNFCVFAHDVGAPGETAALARLVWVQIPEMASRMGVPIREDEGIRKDIGVDVHPKGLLDAIARDSKAATPLREWLGAHIKPDVAAMFEKGADNILNPVMDAFAQANGVRRTDAIASERGMSGIVAMQRGREGSGL